MEQNQFAWGKSQTEFFFELLPEKILDAIEAGGIRCTGRCSALNSMENRVYEVEIVVDESLKLSAAERFRIAKFYRPGRWTKEQIQDLTKQYEEKASKLAEVKEAEVLEES